MAISMALADRENWARKYWWDKTITTNCSLYSDIGNQVVAMCAARKGAQNPFTANVCCYDNLLCNANCSFVREAVCEHTIDTNLHWIDHLDQHPMIKINGDPARKHRFIFYELFDNLFSCTRNLACFTGEPYRLPLVSHLLLALLHMALWFWLLFCLRDLFIMFFFVFVLAPPLVASTLRSIRLVMTTLWEYDASKMC